MSDSAGVRIVDYGPLEEWVDGPLVTELLRIGKLDGADEELFSSLAGGFILPDQGIALADAEAREVRQFNANGELARKHGRRGEGPEEYVFITGMDRCRPEGFTLARARSDEQRATWRRQMEDMEGPAQATFVSDLFASDTHVLVREPSVGESGRWFAFAADGEPQGFLPFSAGTKLLDARDGLLLVEQTDSLGVPAAVLVRVAWPTGGRETPRSESPPEP